MLASACNKDVQLGGACGANAPPLRGEVVEGETAVDELVRIERDGVCNSFQCLTEGGLASYCTELCSYDDSSDTACTSDVDCGIREEHCIQGQCKADDCAAGFVCDTVQENGPLASTRYCVRERDCVTNFDCGDVGNVRCETVACLDACLLTSGDRNTCASHYLYCQPRVELTYCLCPGETEPTNATCTPSQLTCTPPNGDPFPAGAVTLRGICVGNDQKTANTLVSATADGT
ncbi:MAG: hypothetical protein H7Z43_00665 [Clostridia bacterium]|nr:hypothetical protein [Deltaproteobacteria bacterium]